jgi:hypothetical protein
MKSIREINRRLSVNFGAEAAQILIYGVALLILVLGIREVTMLELSEAGLFFGLVLVLILTLQAIIMGTLVGLSAKKK